MDWVWNYFTFTHGARLITGRGELVGWDQQEGIEKEAVAAPLDAASPEVRR
jgi:NADH dehydrogenase